jgi:hypothetical protein
MWGHLAAGLRESEPPARSRKEDTATTSRALAVADVEMRLARLVDETTKLRADIAKLTGPHRPS